MGDASQNEQPGRGQFADDVTVHSDIGTGGSLDDDAHGLLVVDHLGAAIRSHRPDNANGVGGSLVRAHILRWISSAVGDETWEFLVDPVDLMGGHHRSRRARSAVSGNCCDIGVVGHHRVLPTWQAVTS